MTKHWTESLPDDACDDAVEWAQAYPTPQAAWDACERADWMLWIATRAAGGWGTASHRQIAFAVAACAGTALRYVPAGETRPAAALDLVERYGRGEPVTREALRAAAALKDMAAIVRTIIPKVPRLAIAKAEGREP